MNKSKMLLLGLLASTGANATEISAPISQLASSPAILAVAIAEAGASASLALDPQARNFITQERSDLDSYVDSAIDRISLQLEQRILATLKQLQSSN